MYACRFAAFALPQVSAARRCALLFAACALTLSLATQPALAQPKALSFGGNSFNGFGRAANQTFSGNMRVLNMTGNLHKVSGKINIKPSLENAVKSVVEPKMRKKIIDELPKKKKHGFTPYFMAFTPPTNFARDSLHVGTDLNGFTLRYVRRGAKVTIGLHTPDVAFGIGIDRRANPVFVIPLDYELIIDVDTVTSSPAIRNVQVKINAGRAQGGNLTGAVGVVANDVVSFLGGPDFIALTQREINAAGGSVTGPLGIQLKQLAPNLVAKNGGKVTIRPQMAQDNFLVLEVRKYSPPQPNLDPR